MCASVYVGMKKTKTPDWNDLKHGPIVVLDSPLTPVYSGYGVLLERGQVSQNVIPCEKFTSPIT